MEHQLPPLPYDYKALEPYIDGLTMEIHHDRHHKAYVDKLNEIVKGTEAIQGKTIEELLKNLDAIPEGARTPVRNFGGGHYNHSFFWKVMAAPASGGGGEPAGALKGAIDVQFGGFANFREQFTNVANSVFGSGWTWLVADSAGNLSIISTPNQDSPISMGFTPITVLDEWEHAYYLGYQNRRPDYVKAFWSVADWNQAEENFNNLF